MAIKGMNSTIRLYFLSILFITSCTKPEKLVLENYVDTFTKDTWYDIDLSSNQKITAIGGYVWSEGFALTSDLSLSNVKIDSISNKGLFDLCRTSSDELLTVGTDGYLYRQAHQEGEWQFYRLTHWNILMRIHEVKDNFFAFGGKSNEHGYVYKINNTYQIDTTYFFPFEISDAIITDSLIVAFGWGNIMISPIDSIAWTILPNDGDFFASGIMMENSSGIIIGYNGKMLKTIDGGKHWSNFSPNIAHSGFNAFRAIVQFDDGELMICGNDGKFWVSADRGENWNYYRLSKNVDIYGSIKTAPSEYILCGSEGLLVQIKTNN